MRINIFPVQLPVCRVTIADYDPFKILQRYSGVRPHKEKINISKEIINKTRGAEAPYAARINHTPLRGEQQATVL